MENLYKTDYTQWLSKQRELLAQRQFDQLDIDNLLEAMEYEMGNSIRAFDSHLTILLLHLLKYDYQKRVLKDPWVESMVAHLWVTSIGQSRVQINRHLKGDHCLESKADELITDVYQDAKKLAVKEMNQHARSESQKLDRSSFPDQCPWTFEQIMTEDWLPEADHE
ncbi:DUF29 domain-containing protein [Endozoicomonas sp. ALD040]|uniref:DUF29 domain-containing protein n=1 Tax=unclassified Endozoicomonas TaxID=2644528 RepID=UPI003BAEBDAD